MEVFGLDIGSYSIKVAQVRREEGKLELLALGRSPTPPKGLESEAEADLVEVATVIKKLLAEAKITTRNVVASLPESKVVTKVLDFPKMKEEELRAAVKFEAEAFVPFPLNEANLDLEVVSEEEKGMKVMVVAAPKRLVDKYLQVFSLSGIVPQALETEMMALVRAVVPSQFPPCLLVDFGAKTCDLGVVEKGKIYSVRSIPTAGEAFTRALAVALSLEEIQAEEYKKTFGLSEELEGKIQKSLLPILEVVASEMRKAIQAYNEEKEDGLRKVILAGGSAGLPEMGPLLAKKLGLEVITADPFLKLTFEKANFPNLASEGAIFSVAVGLAEREFK